MARMAGWVVGFSFAVRLCSLPRALRLLSTAARNQPDNNLDQEELRTAVDAVLGTRIFALQPICWKRAAILHRYLALNGVETRIVFGVRNEAEGALSGHAWLEADGRPILESSPPEFVVTYTFPSNESCKTPLAVFTGDTA